MFRQNPAGPGLIVSSLDLVKPPIPIFRKKNSLGMDLSWNIANLGTQIWLLYVAVIK